ncbi:hypothetical protein OSTOST_22383 [Ostertagia ostertagi]
MIYPEYTDTDDVKAIQGFTEVLKKTLSLTVDHGELEKQGCLTDAVKGALNDSAVFAALIPSEYGGLGLGYKDQVKIFEDLSLDWNIYANVVAVNALTTTLLLYGSDKLKEKYFPLISSGKCRPVVAFVDNSSFMSRVSVPPMRHRDNSCEGYSVAPTRMAQVQLLL